MSTRSVKRSLHNWGGLTGCG